MSLIVDTKQVPGQVRAALGAAEQGADATGKNIGSKMSSGIATALKAGAIGSGLAVGGLMATALVKGMGRLTAIDTAEGKLRGLGHTAESTAQVMESALASVKGTAFGLGDAATIAASAVAAGIAPGEQLTNYLKLTADAATIAGTSLEEMGSIINGTTTSGVVFTDTLNQLSDRGVPIFTWLQDEYKVTGAELSKMVSDGEVDSATFRKVISDNIGGAALESGNTVKGAFENMKASIGRLGAEAIGPGFERLPAAMAGITAAFDETAKHVGPLAQAVDELIFGKLLPENFDIGGAIAGVTSKGLDFATAAVTSFGTWVDTAGPGIASKISGIFSAALDSDLVQTSGYRLTEVFNTLLGTVQKVGPSLAGIATSLVNASGALGVSSWGVFLSALEVTANIADAVLVPAFAALSGLMSANQGIVTALVGAYAGFKLISMVAATQGMQRLQGASTSAFGAFRNGARGIADTQRMFAATGTQISRLGASVAYLSTGTGSVARMASSFRNAQSSVSRFGSALGTAAAAGTGMRIAAGGLMNAMGGPFGIAMAAGIGALVLFGQNSQKAAAHQRELKEAAEGLGKALYASNGELNATTQRAAATALETSKLAGTGRSLVEFLEAVGVSGGVASKGLAGSRLEMQETLKVLEEQARIEAEVNKERVGKGSEGFASSALGSLFNIGGSKDKANEAANALADFKKLDEEARKVQESQTRLSFAAGFIDASGTSTALGTMTETMKQFQDSTGGAAAKIDILNGGLATLRGDSMSVEASQKAVNDALRSFGSAAAEAGAGVVDAGGKINTTTEAGSRLWDAMAQVQSAFDNAGSAAFTSAMQQTNSVEQAAAAAEAAGQRVRDDFINQQIQSGRTREYAEALANTYRLFPADLKTNVSVVGIPKAGAELDAFTKQQRQIAIDVELRRINSVDASLPAWSAERARAIWGIEGNHLGGRLPQYATGGKLPTTGPGTGMVDGFLGVGADGVPRARLDKGEWVINGRSSDKYDRELAAINAGTFPKLPGYAEGGRNGIANALAAGASVDGNKYAWGGTGPTNFDCSGFVGWLQQIVMGVTGSVKRLYTTYSLLGSSGVAGLQPGLGPAGTQFQVGVSEEHMAATVGGHSAESGGAHGTSGLDNGRANAQSSQFPFKWHLPNSMIAGWNEAQGTSIGATSEVTWTDKQELDLQSADIAVQQAKEARDKVYADEKKSQADRDQADVKVRQAEQKVVDLQAKKDEAGTGKKGPSPQAPELSKAYTDAEIERLEAQMQVDDADERRNDVYADAEASPNDRLRADIALQEAKDGLAEVLKGKQETGSKDYSLNGILKSFGHNAVDALFTGLEGQDYFGIGESRWLSTDFAELMGKPAIPAPTPATFTQAEIDAQTGGMSAAEILERWGVKAPKVFDDGGWLMPGEMGINLSQRPEPIFNSPGQLQAFAGSTLAPAKPTSVSNDHSVNFNAPISTANFEEFARWMRLEQQKKVHGFTGSW
ncbi:tape measure protein [Rhodococcus sp. IEGM 1241]|uniref:tape measure protein n=1 Tax=Rhodococcus sp. IEGM 1241 TaxID=3082228 RepID=UPI002953042A|nr:tape measure protein [Rhodococcus sp. IEGM 1241]MDV8013237.1 tape measure protein [Rhodococcus sp. IEGM 1241]